MELSERDRMILGIEASWWTGGATKDAVISSRLGIGTTRYHELLNELIDRPEAEAYDPLVVRRLRRTRDRYRRRRADTAGAITQEYRS